MSSVNITGSPWCSLLSDLVLYSCATVVVCVCACACVCVCVCVCACTYVGGCECVQVHLLACLHACIDDGADVTTTRNSQEQQ